MKNARSKMENKPISINELKDGYFSLKINKSTGHNDISYNVVSKCFGELCTPLKHIIYFDLSFKNGMFPDSLKIAKVTLVYKFGDSSSLSNYRPISIHIFLKSSNISCLHNYITTYKKIKYFILNNSVFKQGTPLIMLLSNIQTYCLDLNHT